MRIYWVIMSGVGLLIAFMGVFASMLAVVGAVLFVGCAIIEHLIELKEQVKDRLDCLIKAAQAEAKARG